MTDAPNRPEDPPPPPIGDTAVLRVNAHSTASCPVCELHVRKGEAAMETDLGYVVHSYCWERNR